MTNEMISNQDVAVRLECVPADACRGLTLRVGYAATPFGRLEMAFLPRGIGWCGFVDDEETLPMASQALRAYWPEVEWVFDDAPTQALVERLFPGMALQEPPPPLRAVVHGTAFQVEVWRMLLNIPRGAVWRYLDVAQAIGRPGAARVVGQAIGRNPLAIILPCHRVVPSGGRQGGYRWGVERKQAILAHERQLLF